jgi:hypothetical protein
MKSNNASMLEHACDDMVSTGVSLRTPLLDLLLAVSFITPLSITCGETSVL